LGGGGPKVIFKKNGIENQNITNIYRNAPEFKIKDVKGNKIGTVFQIKLKEYSQEEAAKNLRLQMNQLPFEVKEKLIGANRISGIYQRVPGTIYFTGEAAESIEKHKILHLDVINKEYFEIRMEGDFSESFTESLHSPLAALVLYDLEAKVVDS
jgi:hypothetical protein